MVISEIAVHRRTPVFFLVFVTVAAGAYSYRSLPLESSPDVQIPNVFVSTTYRGVSPEDIEKSITIEIEQKLKGLEGVKKIESSSAEGASTINIEFNTGVDIDDALVKVKDKVDLAKGELPLDLEDDPSVFEVNLSEMPILVLTLSGPGGLRQLTRIAERLEEEIEGIPGVLDVEVVGAVKREIQILLDPDKMTLYAVPFSDLQSTVKGENANVSGGTIRTAEGKYQLRLPGEFKTKDDVDNLIVSMKGEGPVYLRDIAQVVDGIEDRTSYARIDGQDAVSLYVKKRTGENIVTIVDAVDEVLERNRALLPTGTVITRSQDRAQDIRTMLADLENNIATGFILVVAVVCLAMGLRNALLVGLSIPLPMLITFVVLQGLGITLNMVVLFSLTLALGMLVDNAIVIIENIYRFMQQGVPRVEAAIHATAEVAWPIIGSSLTTIFAFAPLLLWEGIMGGFMIFLPKTVIITLASCLFVALIINPAMAAALMKNDYRGAPTTAAAVTAGGEHPMLTGGGVILDLYRGMLRLALRFRLAVVGLAGVTLVGCVAFWLLRVGLKTPQEFFPSIAPKMAQVTIKTPRGADLDYVDAMVREVACRIFDRRAGSDEEESGRMAKLTYEQCLQVRSAERADGTTYPTVSWLPDVLYVSERAVGSDSSGGFGEGGGSQVTVRLLELAEQRGDAKATLTTIEGLVKGVAGAEFTVGAQREGPPTGAPINIEIAGDDFELLGELSDQVKAAVATIPNVRNVRTNFEQGSPTLQIDLDRKLAKALGLSTQLVGYVIKTSFNGLEVSTWRESDEDYRIMVRIPEGRRRLVDTLRTMYLPSPTVGQVPLTTVARLKYVGGLGTITRRDHKRVVTVKADVDETKTTGIVARMQAQALMSGVAVPPGYALRFTGENEFQQESQDFLNWAMAVALLCILFILVAQFNSVTNPLIIMSAVVLSLAGVFLGLGVHQMPFGIIMVSVGVISLAGVVVNNAIVLIDYTEQLEARGLSVGDAIVAAGATRLRPVLLTAVTTVLGLVPMILGISYDFRNMQMQWVSESSQWWSSMAVSVSYGLGLATMLTLFVVPVLYSLIDSARYWVPRCLVAPVRLWWWPFDRVFGTSYGARWAG